MSVSTLCPDTVSKRMSLLGAGSVYARSVSRKARNHELGLDRRITATKGAHARAALCCQHQMQGSAA